MILQEGEDLADIRLGTLFNVLVVGASANCCRRLVGSETRCCEHVDVALDLVGQDSVLAGL